MLGEISLSRSLAVRSKGQGIQTLQEEGPGGSKWTILNVIMDSSSFFISSYHIRGLSSNNIKVVNDIIEEYGEDKIVIGIQEHFQLKKNLRKINNSFQRMAIIAKEAFKQNTGVNNGRPRGGIAILVPKSLRSSVGVINCRSWRIQGITMVVGTLKYLVNNVYLPNDMRGGHAKCTELLDTLAEVSELIRNNKHDVLVKLGDLNADTRRDTKHVEYVKDSWEKFGMETLCDDLDYTCGTNVIDHIVVYKYQWDMFSETKALHPLENSSDHDPIVTRVLAPGWTKQIEENDDSEKAEPILKFEWEKANESKRDEFNKHLEKNLKDSQISGKILAGKTLSCRNTKCKDTECIAEIDGLFNTICNDMIDSCTNTIGMKKSNNAKNKRKASGKNTKTNYNKDLKSVVDWNELVKPFQKTVQFWFEIWRSCGKLKSGEVFNIMKKTKSQYHLAIRRVKRLENYLLNCKLLDGSAKTDDIFENIKHTRKDLNKVTANVEGETGSKAAEVFATKYRELFNSVEDSEKMEEIKESVENDIAENEENAIGYVTEDVIREAIARLKTSKSDPCSSLNTDCFKEAPPILHSSLVQFYTACLIHNYVPGQILIAKIIPLLKDSNGDINATDNYRSIALSSIFLKIWDWVVLLLFGENLKSHELQFGFQKGSGTEVCTWTLLEAIDHYIQRGNSAYVVFMDCSKAFDKVIHSNLFQKMRTAAAHPLYIRLLMYIYRNQSGVVYWDGYL